MLIGTPFVNRLRRPCRLLILRCLNSLAARISKVTFGCELRNSRILLEQFPQGLVERNQVMEQGVCDLFLKWFSKKLTSACCPWLLEHQFLQTEPLLHLISYSRYTACPCWLGEKFVWKSLGCILHMKKKSSSSTVVPTLQWCLVPLWATLSLLRDQHQSKQ